MRSYGWSKGQHSNQSGIHSVNPRERKREREKEIDRERDRGGGGERERERDISQLVSLKAVSSSQIV